MKKVIKTMFFLLLWAVIIPGIAGGGIMWLWNGIIPQVSDWGAIGYWQGVGMFFLGQLLSAGFMIGCLLLGGMLHASGVFHHRHGHHNHWHSMTDEQRREFFERRRQWFDMMHSRNTDGSNGGE